MAITFQIDVTISDSGAPSANTTVSSRVEIESVNDNAPDMMVAVSGLCVTDPLPEGPALLLQPALQSQNIEKREALLLRSALKQPVRMSFPSWCYV